MTPECWFCGKPIHSHDAAETLHGTVAVHTSCVRRDKDDEDRLEDVVLKQVA